MPGTVKHVPEDHRTVAPYLAIKDTARAGRPRGGPAPGVSYVAVLRARASGHALDAPRSRRRPLLITDGPFAETREHLG